ncbi:MAG: aminotransferase class V-fold PLP-dependent enzyme [Lachnospiraceae bacterium]|nr:aminotransferase class V-fold PLP-dependent enzyme [Lachnospiraceae bacterium]MBR1524321.1 aminotransferase class V-fold PLP-dependent enzyme [Lachnospiraceae bacterium]
MIYLNNAATSYPKPGVVKEAYLNALEALPSGQFRSAGVSDNSDIFGLCRKRLGEILGVSESDRIYFASGSTEGLNAVISGLGIRSEQVITTVTEHNSVLRPLYNLPQIKGEPVLLPCDKDGVVSPELFEREAKKGKARALILNHCSNVTGAIQDAAAFGEIAKRYGLLFILDVSQSAGCMEVDADGWNVSALAFTGHKSLMGVQGTGGYYVRGDIPFKPLKYGGTGYDSSRIVYEDEDYEYEVGTQNAAGIVALSAALEWIKEQGINDIVEKEHELTDYFINGLLSVKGVRIFGQELKARGPVVSFNLESFSPSDLAYILQNSYGIVTRAGLHCTPLIHDHIGSGEKGTLRVSFSYFSSKDDAAAVITALKELVG